MRKIYQILLAVLFIGSSFSTYAQKNFFTVVNENAAKSFAQGKRTIAPQKFATVKAGVQELKTFLWSLPDEKNLNRNTAPVLEIPMPDGSSAKFRVWQSSVQEARIEAQFPSIKTFAGQGIDDPFASVRFDYTDFGFHAQVISSATGNFNIDPYKRGDVNYYMSYYNKDNSRDPGFHCETIADLPTDLSGRPSVVPVGPCRGTQLYTYRLAVACTGEYAIAVGGTTAALLHSAIVTSVNRISGVYENDLSIRLILIAGNATVEYMDPTTDPFTGNNSPGTLINESQTVISANIGAANYDIGHTFSTGGGGVAQLGCVCGANKARGVTGIPNPVGDDYDIDFVAHEMGHQFGGSHTFNSTTANCGGGNRSAATAYEPGSGTTIQAYAGICSTDDIQLHSDPFFHTASFDQISVFVESGGNCHGTIATGNTLPVITAMNNNGASIPIGTPFTLTATATDANGDALTYCWEGWDLGTGGAWNNGSASATSPLWKSRIPKISGSRTFPDIAVILANYPASPAATMGGLKGETLPQVARIMKFRLTVRDNRAGGGGVVTGGDGCGTFTAPFSLNVTGTSPFAVTVPNGGESYSAGSTQTVTWNVVGTDIAPFSVANVKVSLSTDGGLTYPTVISASTPNDGSEALIIPGPATTTARIKVEALGNVFFDISNANFTITAATGPTVTLSSGIGTNNQTVCINTPIVNITYTTAGGVTAATVSGLPAGLSGTYSGGTNGTVTISGTPNTAGTSTYTVTTSGGGGAATATGTIIVNPNVTLTLTSAAATTSQTVNINTAITNITYSAANGATGATVTGLPTGVTGSYAGGVFTISGTPTIAGTFPYTVTTTGGCSTASLSGTITVNLVASITLSSAAGTNNQIKCVNTTITPITYTTAGGVTNVTVSPLPAGVTGSYSGGTNGTFTISGTPSVTGTFNYTVTTSGGTGVATANGTILVNGLSTITLTSAAGTTNQTVNINTPITNITYSTTGGVTGATVGGLPAGVTGSYSGGTNGNVTISGTPTASGVFTYTVSIVGGCGTPTATGTITVNLVPTITLSSAAGTNAQAVCVNTAITTISYITAGGVTNATVAGLPTGVTGVYSGGTNGTFTINGTPTITGPFSYTITTSGGISPATATGTITVGTVSSITLTSAAGTNAQTTCINAAITNITYSTLGGVTGATVTGLPAGITGAYSGGTNGTVTISGTPTASGPFTYTVTTSGGCSVVMAIGTITVNPVVTTTLSSAAGTNSQTKCINTAITNITYSTANGVTGATVAGLPAGVTGAYTGGTNGTVTISGTPTAAGTFTYTLTTSGGCSTASATGTIIVNPNSTITLSSAAGTNSQVLCINTPITSITYTTNISVTGATVTGLPAGVTGAFAGSTFTISGTPTAAGIFNYIVTTTGGCGAAATATGTITVNPLATATLTSAAGTNNQTICSAALTNIVYTIANGTGASATGLPAGVTGTYTAGVFTISGTPTAPGVFSYTVTTSGGCGVATATGTITVTGGPVITQQPVSITSCSTSATFTVVATGTGISYVWQVSTNGGATFTNISPAQTSNTLVLSGLTPAQSTFRYRVIVSTACGSVTSNEVTAQVGTPPVVVLTASPSTAYNPSVGGGLYVTVSPVGNYVYQWKRNGVIIQNVLGPSLTAANGLLFEFGTYVVTAFDVATGCFGVSNSVTITDIPTVRDHLFISPNPAIDIVRVSYYSSTTAAQVRGIELYDSKGARVMVKDFTVTGTYGTMTLDLSKMIQGTYMIVLRDASGKKIASDRIIKL